ncbi:hypothetical protein [uncultured Azonexus sp.]|uniref:hypothetical protein n=1 Tax=uncultured Azonexus sp. TaxID=520307 RepID=UPI0026243B12|nr:hypothetical protein [uncultured Azonexus sp.]
MTPYELFYLIVGGAGALFYVLLRRFGFSKVSAKKKSEKFEFYILIILMLLLAVITLIYS